MSEFMLAAEVARLVGLTPAAVRAAAKSGRLAVAETTDSGVRLFRKDDVEAYLKDRGVAAEKSPASTAGA